LKLKRKNSPCYCYCCCCCYYYLSSLTYFTKERRIYTHTKNFALLLFAIFPIFKICNDNNSDYGADAAAAAADADDDDIIINN